MCKVKQILFLVLLLLSARLVAQESLDAKSSLAIGFDFGVNGNVLNGFFGKESLFYRPSPSLTLDYKFGNNIGGLYASVNFQQYKYKGVQLQYISVPTLVYLRVGKKFQYQLGLGISQNFRVGQQLEDWVYMQERYKKINTTKYGTGIVLNTSFLYTCKNDRHQFALNFFFNAVFPPQIRYPESGGFGRYLDDYKRLLGYRLSLAYKYVLFRRK